MPFVQVETETYLLPDGNSIVEETDGTYSHRSAYGGREIWCSGHPNIKEAKECWKKGFDQFNSRGRKKSMANIYNRSIDFEAGARMVAAMLVTKGISFEFTKKSKTEYQFTVEFQHLTSLDVCVDACLPYPINTDRTKMMAPDIKFPNRMD